MRVLIIGAGSAGRHLAAKLSEERHDIVIIDHNEEVLADIAVQFDIQTIHGEGSSPRVLEKAGLFQTDLLVAVSDVDEVNLLACAFAHAAEVPRKVARVSNPDFLHAHAKLDLQKMGVDLVINQKEECADEIYTILRMPGTLEAVDMLEGRVLAIGLKIHMDSPLVSQTLTNFPNPELLQHVRFIGVMRADDLIIPKGDTELMIGDDIYLCGEPAAVNAFLEWANPEHERFGKVIIAGGGDLGLQLALRMEKTTTPVVLIEKNKERAEACSLRLDRTLVINGDALDSITLENSGVIHGCAFVATTGSDENNIMICLMAEKAGATFTLAQVTRPEYVPIIGSLSLLDRAVSSHMSMINAILHFVRGKNVKAAALLHKLPGELLDVALAPDHRWVKQSIKSLRMPHGIIIATVERNRVILPPTGELVLQAGDRLILFAVPSAVSRIEDLFRG